MNVKTKEKLKVGVLGCGQFSKHFVKLFLEHPYVDTVVACDTNHTNAEAFGNEFGIDYCYSLDELLEKD